MDFSLFRIGILSFGQFWGEKMRNFAGFRGIWNFFGEKIINKIKF
jgi:hypothetical protein